MLPTTAPTRPGHRRGLTAVTATLAVLTALGAVLLGTASPAAAHAVLTESSPASGAVVDGAPQRVTLTFSEAVHLTDDSVRVLAPDGERADTGPARDIGTGSTHRYAAPLEDDLRDGTYTVAWHAVSADSHPISGAFTFSVGAPSDTAVDLPRQEAGGGTVGLLHDLARYAAYAGFLLLVGGTAFVLTCWPAGVRVRAVQRVVTLGWVQLTAATLAVLLLRVPFTGSGDLSDALDPGALADVAGTRTGTALTSRLLLLAAAALFTAVLFSTYRAPDRERRRSRRGVVTGLAVSGTATAAGLATTWAASEHAATGIQTGIAMPVDVLHLLAAATWLGGLATLTAALWSGTGDVPRRAVTRFSRVALGSVTVLAATGLYQSWRQVGTLPALTGTDYGRLLLAKVALVAVLVTLGWFSRRWTARLSRGGPGDETADTTHHAAGGTSAPPALAAPATRPGPAATATADGPPPGPTAHGAASGDGPERAAQLARQRAAVEAARRKRRRTSDPRRSRLRRSVLAESTVAVVILAVTTLLTGTEPARTAASTGAADAAPGPDTEAPAPASPRELTVPFDTGGPQGRGTARVTLDPGRTGRNALDVRLVGPGGQPMDVPEVKVSFTLPAKDLGPLRVTPERAGDGRWSAPGTLLPVPGAWEMALTVRTSDIDQTTLTRTLRVR